MTAIASLLVETNGMPKFKIKRKKEFTLIFSILIVSDTR